MKIPQQPEDQDALVSPVMRKKAPIKMKTPGMGTMAGAPRYKAGLPSMGKIEPGELPFTESKGMAKGGSASSRADGCAQRGKTRA
jgi:hypothetical protein